MDYIKDSFNACGLGRFFCGEVSRFSGVNRLYGGGIERIKKCDKIIINLSYLVL